MRRIDLAFIMTHDFLDARFFMHAAGVAGKVVPAFASGKLDTVIGFSAHHPQGQWAHAKFNEGYVALGRSGKLKEIWGK